MACCSGKCGCGAGCGCGNGCKGCKMLLDLNCGEKIEKSPILSASASDIGSLNEEVTVAGESGCENIPEGCKCSPCKCSPCNC
eukprot:Gb_05794 [translate_table: standard]